MLRAADVDGDRIVHLNPRAHSKQALGNIEAGSIPQVIRVWFECQALIDRWSCLSECRASPAVFE